MKVLFYYTYLVYTRVIKDDEPYATTVFVLSLIEGSLAFVTTNLLLAHYYCFTLGKWYGISLVLGLILINYITFNRSGLSRRIVAQKPRLFKSHFFSVLFVGLVFIVGATSLIWGPFLIKAILDQC